MSSFTGIGFFYRRWMATVCNYRLGIETLIASIVVLLGRIATTASDSVVVCLCAYVSVCGCVCVCLLVTFVSPAKTAEPIKMPFGVLNWVGPRNHVLHGGPDLQGDGAIFWEKWLPIVKYRDTLPSAVQKRLNRSRCRLG